MIVEMLRWTKSRALSTQPMLVPFIIATAISSIHALKIHESNTNINKIEENLGQHTYKEHERPKGDPLESDFVRTTEQLNGNSTVLGINESRLKSLILALQKMRDYGNDLTITSQSEAFLSSHEQLEDMIEHLQNYCTTLLYRNDSEQKRTQTHLAVVSVSKVASTSGAK